MRRLLAVVLAAVMLAGPTGMAGLAQDATPAAGATPDARSAVNLDPQALAEFDAYVAAQLDRFGVPGAAVAVVHGGETIFANGYGARSLGSDDPVTADTLMMIGSNTKSMTALMAATLVDDGFASWDEPLTRLLPDLRLSDADLTERVTLADSFCACTGLPRRDVELILNYDDLSPESLIAAMARIPVTAPFGEEFQYSNQMFAIGGYAAARAAGAPLDGLQAGYELAMRERVLGPLGMDRSTFSLSDVLADGDYALPHGSTLDHEVAPVRLQSDQAFAESVAPAGGMWSSANEMADYIGMQLAGGVARDGRRIVSAQNLDRTRQTRVALPPDETAPAPLATAITGYAMGWGTGSWHDQPLVNHSGGTLGFTSEVAFLPESDLGVVILTNGGPLAGPFAYAVQYRLFELAFGSDPEVDPLLTALLAQAAAVRAAASAGIGAVDPAVVGPFAGRYVHPDLGEIVLRLDGDRLYIDAGEATSELLSLTRGAAYVFADPPLAGAPATIGLRFDAAGNPEVVLDAQSETEPLTYVFTALTTAATPTP